MPAMACSVIECGAHEGQCLVLHAHDAVPFLLYQEIMQVSKDELWALHEPQHPASQLCT